MGVTLDILRTSGTIPLAMAWLRMYKNGVANEFAASLIILLGIPIDVLDSSNSLNSLVIFSFVTGDNIKLEEGEQLISRVGSSSLSSIVFARLGPTFTKCSLN